MPDLLRGTLVADYYGPQHYARINGLLSAFVVAARATGPLLAGIAATALHADTAIFAGAAVLALTSAFAVRRAHQAHTAENAHQPGQAAR